MRLNFLLSIALAVILLSGCTAQQKAEEQQTEPVSEPEAPDMGEISQEPETQQDPLEELMERCTDSDAAASISPCEEGTFCVNYTVPGTVEAKEGLVTRKASDACEKDSSGRVVLNEVACENNRHGLNYHIKFCADINPDFECLTDENQRGYCGLP